jgi:hypothetical protein|tara:strand:- start:371 stop:2020 length:1650 start_codon:yes stop_codon:yes gene_type:complete
MSDLKKESLEIPLPKPKKLKTVRQKAKQSAKEALARSRKKVAAAEQVLRSAKKHADNVKTKFKTIDKTLDGKEQQLITQDVIDSAPKNVQDHIGSQKIIFKPNVGPQTDFLAAPEREVFYGGARGGGKSYAMLIDPLRYCHKAGHRALLLRRTMPELRDIINHSQRLYSQAFPGAKWREQEKEWRFPSGAKIEFGYAENMTDALRYQGQSYTWIGIDELPQYPSPDIYNFLRSSLRSVDPSIPVYLRATGNPGNVGSQWVREMFVNPAVPNTTFDIRIDTPVGTKIITRRFIPAKLQDNPYLMQTDDYYAMLASLPEIQKKQFLDGDWDAFEDSAFPEFKKDIHIVEPFEIPKGWQRFRAADWGYSSPACCLWFAIDYDNNLWIYRELYTKKITADIFAQKVLELEQGEYIRYGVLDASTWAKRGDVGPSIAETMIQQGCRWRPSDRTPKSRINGKLEIHKRFKFTDDKGKEPGLRFFSTCRNLIRTLPLLPLDDNNIEDINTHTEDHAYDALRYGCMSRPMHTSYANKLYNRSNTVTNFIPSDKIFGY